MRNSFVALQISSISPIIRIECVANNRKHHSRQFLFSILWWRLVVHCQWNRCKKWTNEKKINRIETNSYHIKNHPIICGSWVFFCNVSHWFDCFAYFIFVCISIQHHSLSVGTFSLSIYAIHFSMRRLNVYGICAICDFNAFNLNWYAVQILYRTNANNCSRGCTSDDRYILFEMIFAFIL